MMTSNQFPSVVLNTSKGARAQVYLYGAHVVSWVPAQGVERLFVSEDSKLQAGTAIRGGVPVIFPQFSQLGSLPKHGLVRTLAWEVKHVEQSMVTLCIRDSEFTRSSWPYAFAAELAVRLEDSSLSIELSVTNTDERAYNFTCALHTYFRLQDIAQTQVEQLLGRQYRDAVLDNQIFVEDQAVLRFTGETDRVYHGCVQDVILRERDRSLRVQQQGFVDTVVWNPGAELCAKLADLKSDDYRNFVCVEAAMADTAVTLEPQASWRGSQVLLT